VADQGAIGLGLLLAEGTGQGTMMSLWTGMVDTGHPDGFQADATRNDASGNPAAPSQSQPRPGTLKDIIWKVRTGARKLSIDCNYGGGNPAPRLIIKANPALGVPADVIKAAPALSGWVTVSIEVAVYATGVLWVWRERTDRRLAVSHLWDNIRVT